MFTFLSLTILAQKRVTGKVTANDTTPIPGASIQVSGTSVGTVTFNDGSFSLNVPEGRNTLIVSYVGFGRKEVAIGNGTDLRIALAEDASQGLNEVIVTGYTAQQKKDIIGAISVINTEDLKATPSPNLAAQLQGRAAGVTVSSTGAPGAAAVVRIRGFQSFGNNNPLYIIDGVPTEDPSQLNPQDIESIQVLKDATASAVYGTRAANGVLIITTRQGKVGRTQVTYENYVGMQVITDGMKPDLLNTPQYIEYLKGSSAPSHRVFGANAASFAIPDFFVVSGPFKGGVAASDPRANASLYSLDPLYQIYKTSPTGTNWFDEISRQGIIQSHQITAAGGTEKALYSVGLNYFNQQGVFKFTKYERYTVRANTSIRPKTWLRFGENLQVSFEDRLGGDQRGEDGAWSQAYRMVPYIPVYDINGGFGGNAVGESGNGTNPIVNLIRNYDDKNQYYKIFGNAFAEVIPLPYITARTSIGVDLGNQFERDIFRKTYERAENQGTTQLTERVYNFVNWTNTLNFQKTIAENHELKVLLGTEAIKRNYKVTRAFGQRFDFDNADFISLDRSGLQSGDRNVLNFNAGQANVPGIGSTTIASLFGRIDYTFQGKYLLNGTLRRDGASVFGPDNRYASFPSVGIGWRVSEENFMKPVSWITDLKLRGGWGRVGSIGNVPVLN